jgi:protein transport protein SEC23
MITRVTTVERWWSSNVHEIVEGFDFEAAIVYLARYCVHKALIEEQQNLRQWLDSSLCKWASYFAQFMKNDPRSFSLPEKMRMFPQSIYHLRRSNFVNRFGSSLDEVIML